MVINYIKNYIKSFDSIDTYTDGTFRYYSLDNPFLSGYFPDGRFIFHFNKNGIENLEKTLLEEMNSRNIRSFKYAINPLCTEQDPAIIIYATKKERKKIEKIIKNIKIDNYRWVDGNPFSISNLMSDYKK